MNWDKQFHLGERPRNRSAWLELDVGTRTLTNVSGAAYVLKYNTASYVALFVAFNGVAYLISRYSS